MAHEIEGNDSLFNTGFVPWHGLGTVLDEPPDTIKCALEASGLGWWVGKEQMFLKDGTEVDGHYCTRREDDKSQLGVVGADYTVLQNEDAFEWFEPLVDSGMIQIVSAGSLRGGRRVWVQAQVVGAEERVRKVEGKDDIVRQHLLIAHSHDGSMNVRGDFVGQRVVCANTLRMAQSEGGELFRIRHTKSVQQRLAYQRDVVETHIDAFHKAMGIARKMAKTPVEAEDMVQFVADVFKPETEVALNNRVDQIIPLFTEGRGNVGESVWDLYNSCTEWLNWERGKDIDSRINSLWFGEAANLNGRAWEAALKLVA